MTVEHNIELDVLKCLKLHHVQRIFDDLPVGDEARFENMLENGVLELIMKILLTLIYNHLIQSKAV